MAKQATVLNFDDTYVEQPFLRGSDMEWIDLRNINGTNLMCEKETLFKIQAKLQARNEKGITFFGSGNYHYVTYLLLKEIQTPFHLVLFDHHSDMLPSLDALLISCGSWVLDSLNHIPLLQKVFLIGAHEKWKKYIPEKYNDKVHVYSDSEIMDWKTFFWELKAYPVYISIDKDVLHPLEAMTAWDHGHVKLKELVEVMIEISTKSRIIGIDVGGEYPYRLTDSYSYHVREAIRKNEFANQVIFKTARKCLTAS